MIDIKILFTAIGRYKQKSLKELSQDMDMAYVTFINKIGKYADIMKISTLEYMLHSLGYTMSISVKDEKGDIIFTADSDPKHPMKSANEIKSKRATFAQNMKNTILNEDGTRKADIGGAFQPNHEPVNNKKYAKSKK